MGFNIKSCACVFVIMMLDLVRGTPTVLPVPIDDLKLLINLTESGKSPQDGVLNDQGNDDDSKRAGCYDWQGHLVQAGDKYAPDGLDLCMQCICDEKHFPVTCHSVSCSPPLNCARPELRKSTCCEYECNEDTGHKDANSTTNGNNNKDDGESITNLSLRLIASTVTSFLVLALLLFMVHRLRQRRLLQAMRRFEAQSRQVHSEDTDSEPYIPDGFMSVECPPYTDPPPPYSPPKPPQIMPGEQPPPYEEINQNAGSTHLSRNENIGSNSSGTPMPNPPAAASIHSGESALRNSHSRSLESRHQRSVSTGGGPMRAPNTLPAYASTDVIDGLSGLVISPGNENDVVTYTVFDDHLVITPSTYIRVQAIPTVTAFQRFSNIFKRDNGSSGDHRRHVRPASDYSTAHYSTVPRNEVIAPFDARSSNHTNTDSCESTRATDRMCLSYDGLQTAQSLCAVSSNSPCNMAEPPVQHYTSSSVAPSSRAVSPQVQAFTSPQDSGHHNVESSPSFHTSSSSAACWAECQSLSGTTATTSDALRLKNVSLHSASRPQRNVEGVTSPQKQNNTLTSPGKDGNYQSLASFIKSNPSSMLVDNTEQSSDLTLDRASEPASHPEHNILPKYFSTFPLKSFQPSTSFIGQRQPSLEHVHLTSASVSSSSSPSPPPTGAMRRSLSALSQTSIFSVCSETGEKRMRNPFAKQDEAAKTLPSDSQYPDSIQTARTNVLLQSYPIGSSPVLVRNSEFHRAHALDSYSQGLVNNSFDTQDHTNDRSNPAAAKSNDYQTFLPSLTNMPLTKFGPVLSSATAEASAHNLADTENYNLNSMMMDKSPLTKELPVLYNDHLLSQETGTKPQTFNGDCMARSNVAIAENELSQLESAVKSDKSHESSKKHKKKKLKEKNSTSSPRQTKPKHTSSSPRHVRLHIGDTVEDKARHSRPADKKIPAGISKLSVRFTEPHNSKQMARSLCDGGMMYGNADVYRSLGTDAGLAHPLQQSFCPTYMAHPEFLSPPSKSMFNDLNQPLHQTVSYDTATPVMSKSADAVFQLKKKTSHRRSALHVPSPSRHKARPKSLTATVDLCQEKKDALPVAVDINMMNRGAKSGFGHDLNFIDLTGKSDWHLGQEAYNRYGYDPAPGVNNTSTFKGMAKNDGNVEAPCATSRAPVTQHPGNKSGLSNDLSFVIRAGCSANRSKKRQSLPTAPGLCLPPNYGVDRCKQSDLETPVKFRGDKTGHTFDVKLDRVTVDDEATSYV